MESFDAFYENNGCGIILHRGINVLEERSWLLKEVRKKLLKSNNRLDSVAVGLRVLWMTFRGILTPKGHS